MKKACRSAWPRSKKSPSEKGQDAGQHQKDHDEHIGQRRREIARQLAAEDRSQDAAHGELRPCARTALGGSVIARNTSSSRPRSTRSPVTGQPRCAHELGDLGDDRAAVAREDPSARRPRRRSTGSTDGDPGQPRQLAGDASDRRAAAARGAPRCGSASGPPARPACRRRGCGRGDDDGAAAHRLDLLEQMGRDDDRLLRRASRG